MITLFSCPKPFRDPHISVIQRNAIRSWTLLRETPEVILVGEEDGIDSICADMGLRHLAGVDCSDKGTPRLDSVFDRVQKAARYDLLCYVNADIILLNDFIAAARQMANMKNSIFIGRRIDLDVNSPLDFGDFEWASKLRSEAIRNGKPMTLSTDYFLFRKGFYNTLPPFLVGKAAYDLWMIWYARSIGARVIDGSSAVLAVHQNHQHTVSWINAPDKSEVNANTRLAGRWAKSYGLRDANAVLSSDGVKSCQLSAARQRMRVAYAMLRHMLRQIARQAIFGSRPSSRRQPNT